MSDAECVCEPKRAPWMHNHFTYCPFYPWTNEARTLAFRQHLRSMEQATPVVGPNTPETYWHGAGCEEDDRG